MSIPKLSLPLLLSLTVAAVAATGCKEKTKIQDDPKTLSSLSDCRDQLQEKDKYIADLEARLGEAERGGGGDEVVVNLTGDALEISGKGPSQRRPGKGAQAKVDDRELYQAFLGSIRGSRGAMKKCYQSALKKDPSLQAGKTTVTISVSFDTAGKVRTSSVNPKLGDSFASCMNGVAKTLSIPEAPLGVTFRAPVELTPE